MGMGQMQKTVKLNVTTSADLWPYQVIDEIQKVMEQGERDGKEGWEDVSVSEHVARAQVHLCRYIDCCNDENHLAHAFTRLMMAMAIERGYMDDPDDEFVRAAREKEELIRTGEKVVRPERAAMKRARKGSKL